MTRSLINPPLWNLWINGWLSKWHLPKVDDLKASHLQPTTTTTTTTRTTTTTTTTRRRRRRRRRIYTLKIGKDLGPCKDWECPCPTQRKYQLKKVRNPYKNAAISNWTGIALHVLQWSPCGEKVGGKKHFSKSCCLFQMYRNCGFFFCLWQIQKEKRVSEPTFPATPVPVIFQKTAEAFCSNRARLNHGDFYCNKHR